MTDTTLVHQSNDTFSPESDWIRISSKGQGIREGLRELLNTGDLLRMLILRHLKIRFAQTAMGAFWVVLQPLMTALIFSVLFGVFVKVPSDGLPYVAFAYPGMALWTLFAQGFDRGSTSLVLEERLITKVYFPRLVIPLSATLSAIADFIISTLLIFPLALAFGVSLSWRLPLFLIAVPPILFLAIAMGVLTASLSVRYRDLRQVAPFITQLWFYATPVVFPLKVVPEGLKNAVLWNPAGAPILLFRSAFFGTPMPPMWSIMSSYLISILLLTLAVTVFRKVERGMADWL